MILVECYLDEYIVISLGFSKRTIKHCNGKGNVLKLLRSSIGKIGLVDEDIESSQPKDINLYQEIEKTQNLKLCKNKENSDKYLIIISDNIEDWIVKVVENENINLKEYRLSKSDILDKTPQFEQSARFQKLLKDLLKCNEFLTLKKWISKIHST